MFCCGYTLTDFPISIRLTSLALWQSNDCPSASKATLMNMDKYFMWIHYERLHNHNKAKHTKTVCIFLRIYCKSLCLIIKLIDLHRGTLHVRKVGVARYEIVIPHKNKPWSTENETEGQIERNILVTKKTPALLCHYNDTIMSASQIYGVSMVCWTVCSGPDRKK